MAIKGNPMDYNTDSDAQTIKEGMCVFKAPHDTDITGTIRSVNHYCAACSQKDKTITVDSERDCLPPPKTVWAISASGTTFIHDISLCTFCLP